MCPSTDALDAEAEFAATVLRNLLQHIEIKGKDPFHFPYIVSYAWTEGPMMYLVYEAPPSEITWGLARDTRQSIIDPGPWPSLDEAALYYYLVDLEENHVAASFPHPGVPGTIAWHGHRLEGLPERVSDIPEAHRYIR